MSYPLWQDGRVMKSLIKMVQRQLRRPSLPVYRQLELPLAGIRLGEEEWRMVGELQKLRRQLAEL